MVRSRQGIVSLALAALVALGILFTALAITSRAAHGWPWWPVLVQVAGGGVVVGITVWALRQPRGSAGRASRWLAALTIAGLLMVMAVATYLGTVSA